MKNLTLTLTFFFFLVLVLLPLSAVSAECTCETEAQDSDKPKALRYKIAAICSILAASALGVSLPILGDRIPALSSEKNTFFIIKAFAAGVILATGFVHVLPDAFDRLSSPCLGENPWGNFPFPGFTAMVAAILTMMIDSFANSFYKRAHFRKAAPVTGDEEVGGGEHEGHVHVHTHGGHGHAHGGSGFVVENSAAGSADLLRHRIISQVLELGIVIHSIIIGVSLGASVSPKTVRPLVAALTFHQFFEGMGLGGCISQAKFKSRAVLFMVVFFTLTTPLGIGIGIGLSNSYNENSSKALIVEGMLNSASAGILIYMALVDLLAADFMNPRMQSSPKLQLGANASLLFGAGCMSLLAKWA